MAYKLIWAPSARLDLKDIAAFIAEDDPVAAQRFVDSVFQATERLTDFPDSGRIVPDCSNQRVNYRISGNKAGDGETRIR